MLTAGGTFALAIAAGVHEVYLARLPGADLLNSLGNYLRYSIVWPLAVLVLAFEFGSGPRIVGMDESVDAHVATSHRHWLATMVPPAAVVVALFGIILALKMVAVFAEGARSPLGWHVVASVTLNILAPCVMALLLGFVAATRLKRVAGYAVVAAFAFLAGPYSEIVPIVAQAGFLQGKGGLNLYPLRDLFGVLAPDATWYVDPLYGFPMEQARWLLAGFWITLLMALLLPRLTSPRVRWVRFASPGLLCAAGLLLVAFLLPSSELRRDYRLFGGSSQVTEQAYYRLQSEAPAQLQEPARFATSSYEMSLSADRELRATTTVRIANDSSGGEYRFTLYHGYRVLRVHDSQGRPLDYSREGDYVTVRSAEKQERLTFEYRGSGGIYMANSQCVFLPGYFPYYPVPGFVRVWDDLYSAPAMDVVDAGAVKYTVRFKAHVPLVSNLELHEGRFEGKNAAPTFIGGLVTEREIAGHRVAYYPASGSNPEGLSDLITRVSELEREFDIDERVLPDAVPILQAPEFHMLGGATRLPGALLVSGFDESLAGEVLVAAMPRRPDRSNLKEAFVRFFSDSTGAAEASLASLNSSETARPAEPVPSSREIARLENARRSARTEWELVQKYVYPARGVVSRLLLAKVLADGQDEALRDTYRYLSSDSQLSEIEFLTRPSHGGKQ